MFPQGCGELEELIIILRDGDQSGTNGGLKDDEYLLLMMNNLLLEDREKIEQVVGLLKEYFNKNEVYYVKLRASISIMLAYASCKLDDQPQVLYYAQHATSPIWQPNSWNRAFAYWFLGIVQKISGNITETKDALKKAKSLLEKHAKDAQRKGNNQTRELCHEYIRSIEQVINELPETKGPPKWPFSFFGRSASPPTTGPEPTPMKQNEFMADQLRSREMNRGDETSSSKRRDQERTSSPGSRSSLFHITIPVDLHALMNPQWPSRALNVTLYERLREYNRWKSDRISTSTNEDAQTKNPQPAKKPRPIIPSFPIYGRAAAGPSGEPNLDSTELEKADIVYDDFRINFEGKEYGVRFIENEEYNFLDWRRYGWLQVTGESMNKCSPIPIKDDDFVLFAENRDVNSCVKKIVVAVLPEQDTQPPQLIVKRLLKLSTQLPLRTDGFGSEYSKFILHSESSLDKDPKTGISYKNDIEIVKDNQIVGEVIIVAKPL